MKNYTQPIFCSPCFEQRIWGGRKLQTVFGFDIPDGNIGECWAVSAYPKRESYVIGGPFANKSLSEMWKEEPDFFGHPEADALAAGYPFITKIIDAKENLSIQVHPDDAYAEVNENGARGKTECWYVLDCPEDAQLILGHSAQTKEEFASLVETKQWDTLLRKISVKKGDFIQLEPGTIHAITAGVMLLENQQSSDVTYRVYDYDRLENGKPRELHLAKSMDVSTIPSPAGEELVLHTDDAPLNELTMLVSCKFYSVGKLPVKGEAVLSKIAPFTIVSVVEGSGQMKVGETTYSLIPGTNLILPYDYDRAVFSGEMTLIAAMPA